MSDQLVVPGTTKVGKIDRVFARLDPRWLAGASILTAMFTTTSPLLTLGAQDIDGDEAGVMVTGITPGEAVIHLDVTTTDGRSTCKRLVVVVVAC